MSWVLDNDSGGDPDEDETEEAVDSLRRLPITSFSSSRGVSCELWYAGKGEFYDLIRSGVGGVWISKRFLAALLEFISLLVILG